MSDITQEQLSNLLHMSDHENRAAAWVGPMNAAMRVSGLTTPRRQAAFLAQVMVESAELRNLEESLSYSAERLHQVWLLASRILQLLPPTVTRRKSSPIKSMLDAWVMATKPAAMAGNTAGAA